MGLSAAFCSITSPVLAVFAAPVSGTMGRSTFFNQYTLYTLKLEPTTLSSSVGDILDVPIESRRSPSSSSGEHRISSTLI